MEYNNFMNGIYQVFWVNMKLLCTLYDKNYLCI